MKNIVANLISSFWNLLVLMVCVPLYIRFLGVEGYGLIGFFIMLQMLLQIFDLGLTPTMNRMMARYSVNPGLLRESRNFVRTLEIVYMLIGCSIGAVIFLASPFIARHWLKAGDLSMASVSGSIQLMGLLATFQWMINFYTSGLMGLQRQVTAAVVLIVSVTASHALAVFFLWKTEPSVPTFFSLPFDGCCRALCSRLPLFLDGSARLGAYSCVWIFAYPQSDEVFHGHGRDSDCRTPAFTDR